MANSKAGAAGDGTTGKAKRSGAGDQSTGSADGGAPGAAGGTGPAKGGGAAKRSGAAKTAGARKASTKTAGAGKASTKTAGAGRKTAAKGGRPDLRGDLRKFVDENPQGWGHDQWQGLLGHLGQRGHDTSDPDRIGMELERERLTSRVEGVEGVKSRHAKSIAQRFGTLYSLRNAGVDEIEREAKVPREVAERIKKHL